MAKRTEPKGYEVRTFDAPELRLDDDGRYITGHAAVFDKLSVPMFGFREKVRKGAFAKTIQEADIRALWNHDPNHVLGRNKSGTLELKEDETGLFMKIDPPKSAWADAVKESIRRGDVSQASFGFRVIKDIWSTEEGEARRELIEVALLDVSPVTYPAYPDTDVAMRAIASAAVALMGEEHADQGRLFAALRAIHLGEKLTEEQKNLVRAFVEELTVRTSSEQPAPGHCPEAPSSSTEPPIRHSLDILRRRLELNEKSLR